ncbi:YCII-related protein [Beutenbergia cavernae DSM 12333]|uniref:YCII-related protein n=1 Tax=Beutenbergia cavernae (strain ATCC BAA-8 / DSM 12333 / CCUG 43141 / JCM 11478 / NBRC 16432 / NCIMB 13614 / HKI 0122) TaxID=471853 RepID=C5C6D7_BEUC1|nr:YciI family protein [Beutenbergia cavernae]ACQ80343.1 YCII-related protein [Beutenbergia cavernae DSM 12333]
MTQYLISFQASWWTAPEEDLPEVARDAHAVEQEAVAAGAWIFGAGLTGLEHVSVVEADGTITDGPYPETKEFLGGFVIVEVPTREEALQWAAKFAAACRCTQEVREFLPQRTTFE